MNRRQFIGMTGSIALSTMMSGLEARAADGKTLRIVGHAALRMLDPVNTNAYITRNHGYFIYDTLFAIDEHFQPQPQMVDTWSVSDDGLLYEFHLRDGLAFHDGTPVTAKDCVASIRRWAERDPIGARMIKVVRDMRVVDDASFEIALTTRFGSLIEGIAKPSTLPLFVMKAEIAAAPAGTAITTHVGSGPFKFVPEEFQPGVKAVYVKNTAYVPRREPPSGLAGGKLAKVDRVEYLAFPDPQTTVNALVRGEVDMAESITPDMAKQLAASADVVITPTAAQFVPTVRFNWLQKPFDDVKARRAALYAISQADFLAAQIGDEKYYRVCGAMFGCDTALATEVGAVETADQPDLKTAKRLLAESSYKGEKVIVLQPTDLPTLSAIPQLMVQVLRQVGFDAEAAPMDWATYLQRRNLQVPVDKGGWSVAFGSWSLLDLISPLGNLNLDTLGPKGYAGWSSDEELDRLKDAFAAAGTDAERKAIAEKIQARAYELVFYIPLGTWNRAGAWRKSVQGRIDAPVEIYWNVDKL